MTWTDAQTYCRQKYTDLATVENTEEMDQLKSSVPAHRHNGYVWMGLYSNIHWKWSDGYTGTGSHYREWDTAYFEPNFISGNELCGLVTDNGEWGDAFCQNNQSSICYRGTQQDPDFVYVTAPMSWSSAQRYCRENYIDLATVRNHTEHQKIQSSAPSGAWPWFGLYRDPEVFWSDGSGYSFQFWGQGFNLVGSMSVVCGAADLPGSGKWSLKSCGDRFPFVCYSSGSKHVIKLRLKPDDPSLDLNDPAVKAGLLRELQDRLKESGLSGVTLTWREQPDGKVFYKEGQSSEEEDREKCELGN
ncbi:putative C-type lectin domain family 20 member A [Halichoeres trimaculatus]|uniref:putative C-type lectin domain family 20 member A n=1 Tax=Halichoeres trimaculatus TaxID=147232 RepID=UPI003D9EE08C